MVNLYSIAIFLMSCFPLWGSSDDMDHQPDDQIWIVPPIKIVYPAFDPTKIFLIYLDPMILDTIRGYSPLCAGEPLERLLKEKIKSNF